MLSKAAVVERPDLSPPKKKSSMKITLLIKK